MKLSNALLQSGWDICLCLYLIILLPLIIFFLLLSGFMELLRKTRGK